MPTVSRPVTPINPIASYVTPVGGMAAVSDGGYMIIKPASFTYLPLTLVDVIRWRMASSFGEQPLAKSGMLGATASRRTGHSYVWEAEVMLDLRIQAELLLRESYLIGYNGQLTNSSYLSAEIYFKLGWPVAPLTVHPRYYWIPRAKIDAFSPMVEAGDKRRVRYKMAGCANCHCLLLPDQGDPADGGATVAGAYNVYLGRNPNA
jgi:hypothetical protein